VSERLGQFVTNSPAPTQVGHRRASATADSTAPNVHHMAWVWWLLAPIASTAVGAVVIWWRGQGDAGKRLRGADTIAEHQALLRALAQGPTDEELPVTMRILTSEHPSLDGGGRRLL
jgi:hypothetical protein